MSAWRDPIPRSQARRRNPVLEVRRQVAARKRLAGRGVRIGARATGALQRLHLPREVLALGAKVGIADGAFGDFFLRLIVTK